DKEKAGKLSQDQFSQSFTNIVAPPPDAPGGGGMRRGGGLGRGLFDATDANKDGSITAEEFRGSFDKWFTQWDTQKSGSLDSGKLREGLNAALPRPQFGGGRGGGGPGGGRGRGMAAKPTEVEQFTLMCLDRQTGKTLWQQVAREEVPHEGVMRNEGSFSSP